MAVDDRHYVAQRFRITDSASSWYRTLLRLVFVIKEYRYCSQCGCAAVVQNGSVAVLLFGTAHGTSSCNLPSDFDRRAGKGLIRQKHHSTNPFFYWQGSAGYQTPA
jgi:hypothetical protein